MSILNLKINDWMLTHVMSYIAAIFLWVHCPWQSKTYLLQNRIIAHFYDDTLLDWMRNFGLGETPHSNSILEKQFFVCLSLYEMYDDRGKIQHDIDPEHPNHLSRVFHQLNRGQQTRFHLLKERNYHPNPIWLHFLERVAKSF